MKKSRIKKRSVKKSIFRLFGATGAIMMSTAAMAGALSLVYAALEMPDSLVAKWLVRPLAAASLATNPSGGLPSGVGYTTSTTTPPPATLKPTSVGINLNDAPYWGNNRIFTNLAADSGWRLTIASGGSQDGYWDANRNVIKLLPGDYAVRAILRPTAVMKGKSVDVICRWDGVGNVDPNNLDNIKNRVLTANSFRYTQTPNGQNWLNVVLRSVDPTNPVRNFDCRETSAPRDQLFDPTYIANVKRFSTVRFMGWQRTNNNLPITWAARTTPAMGQVYAEADGYAIEHMIALANQAKVNPWFCMPWNADDDYIRKFAELVRDTLDPSLTAYVELSNEVWNWGFSVTTQARDEGVAAGLASDGTALLYRYAQKTGHVMDIWKDVFTGQMNRIVRVAANQNANPWTIQQILTWNNGYIVSRIDAISSAPYFDAYFATTVPDVDAFFVDLKQTMDYRLENAKQYKQLADQRGLRFIPYEAGQHVTGEDVPQLRAIEADPRMGQLYSYYLKRWNAEFGDVIMLFNDVDQTSRFGAWGMLDYIGQSPLEATKSRAVQLFMTSIGQH